MNKQVDSPKGFTKKELDEFTEKCLSFIEVFCATEFYPYQREFSRAIIIDILDNRGNTLTGLFSRQSGKSETMANTAAAMMVLLPRLANLKGEDGFVFPQLKKFRRGLWVGIFTPSDNQSQTTYKRLKGKLASVSSRVFFEDPDFAPEGEEKLDFPINNNTFMELNNGSLCLMMSANKQANIESKSYHLILLDESQDLDETVVNKSIMPMAAAYNGTSVATGTPGFHKGFFHNTIQFNRTEEQRAGMQQLHFQYDYKVCEKYNDDYKKYVAKQRRKIGEDSDEFRMAFKLHWMLERGMAVPEELFNELTVKSRNIETTCRDSALIAGLDFGKGADSTVLTIGRPIFNERDESGRCPVEVIYWWEKLGDDYESIFAELKEELSRFSVETMACDATGVGEPLVDRLTWELPMVTVLPVKFSSQSKDHLYKNFLLMLQDKKVSWPGDARLRKRKYFQMFHHQMTNLQKEYRGQYLACHAPTDQRTAHDDFPDSLALMLWCMHEDAMPYVETADNNQLYRGINWSQQRPQNHPFSLRN